MLGFFAKILNGRRNGKPRPRLAERVRTRLVVEELMPRVLPNATPLGALVHHHATSHTHHHAVVSHSGATGIAVHHDQQANAGGGQQQSDGCGSSCGAESSLTATLSNSSGATGRAEFSTNSGSLEVHVKGAAPSTSLAVSVDGNQVGTIATDASGNGQLEVSQGVTAQAGSTITVGDLTGTFASASTGANGSESGDNGQSGNSGSNDGGSSGGETGDGNGGSASSTELTAQLAAVNGATGVSGKAGFDSGDGELHVCIQGATAGTTYNVTVDGNVVGTLTTDSSGNARVAISSASVQVGSTITIADTAGDPAILQGTFAQNSDN